MSDIVPISDRPKPINIAGKPEQSASQEDQSSSRVELFEEFNSKVAGLTLQLGAMLFFGGIAHYYSESWVDWLPAYLWHVSIWLIPHVFVLGKPSLLNTIGFWICISIVLLQPHTQICKRVRFIGAVHGAASGKRVNAK